MTYQFSKPKAHSSCDDWPEQIEKVAELTNKHPYKLALAKSQGSLSRTICLFQGSHFFLEIFSMTFLDLFLIIFPDQFSSISQMHKFIKIEQTIFKIWPPLTDG